MPRPGWSPPWDAWTPPQDQRLCELAGTMTRAEIAVALEREFHIPRTEHAIRIRAKRLGISLWRHGYSMRDLVQLFGTDHRVIARWWIYEGLLDGARWDGRGPYATWVFTEAQVEAFIRACPWAYDWQRMQPGHRLTRLAEVVNRSDPWLERREAMAYIGLANCNFKKWQKRGLVPWKPRYLAGPHPRVMVRARDLPGIRESIRAAQHAARMRTTELFTAMRRAA